MPQGEGEPVQTQFVFRPNYERFWEVARNDKGFKGLAVAGLCGEQSRAPSERYFFVILWHIFLFLHYKLMAKVRVFSVAFKLWDNG